MRQKVRYLIFYSIFAALMCMSGNIGESLSSFAAVFILMFFALFITENLTGVLNYYVKLVIIGVLFVAVNLYIFTFAQEKERYAVIIIELFWIILGILNFYIKKRLNSLIEDEIVKWAALYFILVICQKILSEVYFISDIDMFDMIVTTFLWRIISIVLHFKEEKMADEKA